MLITVASCGTRDESAAPAAVSGDATSAPSTSIEDALAAARADSDAHPESGYDKDALISYLNGLGFTLTVAGDAADVVFGERADAASANVEQEMAELEAKVTAGQENALRSTENYFDLTTFSRSPLVRPLIDGDGYTKARAKQAAERAAAFVVMTADRP